MVMSLVGDRVRRDGLSVGTLSNWLASQRELVASVPSMLLSAAGFGGRDMGAVIVARAIPEPRASSRWLWPVLLGLLVLIGVVWLSRSRPAGVRAPDAAAVAAPAREAARDVDDAARRAVDAAGRAVADLGPLLMRRLPSGIELNVPSRGIENQVVEFIEDTRQPLEPARWFNFDRLLFATNSAVLEPQSQEQLENVAEILKAYPSVRVKIGGYTDSAGDPRANLRLSAERAASVTNELVRLGVVANRLEAEGYGQEHPVADNSTEAGRARNRRIALRVTQR
jgi:outer membrane protein OmpA-like peptidoglycan-associated protein